jgi:nicotinate phosphoribosyltransferase
LVDFAFRRTHGADAADAVARASAMVGFAATSNVAAAHRHGLAVAGTMAHSYVEAFPNEHEAFRAFAEDHPSRTTFLVDTYDTLGGVKTAIQTVRELGLTGDVGIRLDSGDLNHLSRGARRLLDEAGLEHAQIFASGGLDELEVADLVEGGAPIDAFGIGTQLGVSADAPYVDSVYKLVQYDGRPVMKLSTGKVTAPGRKQVWRDHEGDTIALRDETGMPGAESLLELVMEGGRRTLPDPSIEDMRARFEADLARVSEGSRRLRDPEHTQVARSKALIELTERTRQEALSRS